MNEKVSDQQLMSTLNRLERYAELTDSCFRVPFTRIRFGVDALIGLIPVAGELIGVALSAYLLFEASKLGVSHSLKVKMLKNILIDFLIGLVPFVGDLADFAYKANIRNLELLKSEIDQEKKKRMMILDQSGTPWWNLVTVIFIVLMVVVGCLYLV